MGAIVVTANIIYRQPSFCRSSIEHTQSYIIYYFAHKCGNISTGHNSNRKKNTYLRLCVWNERMREFFVCHLCDHRSTYIVLHTERTNSTRVIDVSELHTSLILISCFIHTECVCLICSYYFAINLLISIKHFFPVEFRNIERVFSSFSTFVL